MPSAPESATDSAPKEFDLAVPSTRISLSEREKVEVAGPMAGAMIKAFGPEPEGDA